MAAERVDLGFWHMVVFVCDTRWIPPSASIIPPPSRQQHSICEGHSQLEQSYFGILILFDMVSCAFHANFPNKETKATLWEMFQWDLSACSVPQELNPGSSFQPSSLTSGTLIVRQCRLSTAATVICRSPSDVSSFCQPLVNDSANVRTRRQKRPDSSFPSSCWWPAFSSKDGIEEPIGCVLWSPFEIPRLFLPCLPRLHPPHLCRSHLSIICYNIDVSIVSYDEWVSVLSPFVLPPCCVPLLTE